LIGSATVQRRLSASLHPQLIPPLLHISTLRWFGKCWIVVDMLKYEFDVEFDVRSAEPDPFRPPFSLCFPSRPPISSLTQIPVTYPTTAPEIAIPELDGKTAKMYR
jgi:ufm1-conjugating enzyme 1